MADFAWDNSPPRPGPQYPIMRVDGPTPIRFVIFSHDLRGIWTHWTKDGSMPCIFPRTECDLCQHKKPRRWKGYMHARNMHSQEEGFIELTPGGAKQLAAQAGPMADLRGIQVKLSRGNGAKTRQKVDVVYALPSSAGMQMPEPKDPSITLLELWGAKGFRLRRPEDDDLDAAQAAS